MNDLQKKYLDETGHRLRRKGFTVLPKNEGVLQVEMAGVLLCHINMRRGMCYDADLVQRNGLEDALDQVRSIAVETQAYMRQMAAAPPLLAEGLSGNYRLLAEFNHIILAGHERDGGYGVEFITWERIRNGTALWQGHYYDNDFGTAKQDFATRSGLVPVNTLFTKEQLADYLENGAGDFDEEIRKILAVVKEYGDRYQKKIPIAIAGGIENREQAEHAFSLGADAVQVATRFVTTEECDADIRYKETYLQAEKEDIIIVKSPVGMPGRAIRNAFMDRVDAGEKIPHSACHGCLRSCNPAEIPYCITDALINAAKGDVEHALLFCGAYAYKAEKLETVKEVMDSLI